MNIKLNYLLFVLVLLSISFLPSLHPFPISSYYDEKRIVQIILLACVAILSIFSPYLRSHISFTLNCISKKNKIIIVAFFLLGIISSYRADLPSFAYLEVSTYFLLLLMVIFISHMIKKKPNADKLIISSFVGSAFLFSVAFLSALVAGMSQGVIDYQTLFVGFDNRRFINQFQSISLPILLVAPLFLKTSKWQSLGLSLISAFWVMLIIVSDGRGVIFASILGIVISGIIFPSHRKKWWLHTIKICVGGLALFILFDLVLSEFQVIAGDLTRITSGGRLKIWLEVLTIIKEAPFLGIGPMHYAIYPHSSVPAHPHNISLQLMLEWGIPSFFLMMIIVCSSFINWSSKLRKTTKDKNSIIFVALCSSFIAAIVHGHLSGVFVMPLSQISFVVVCGWMLGLYSSEESKKIEKNSYKTVILIPTFLALAGMLNGSHPHIINQLTTERIEIEDKHLYLNGQYPSAKQPRFWLRTQIEDHPESK